MFKLYLGNTDYFESIVVLKGLVASGEAYPDIIKYKTLAVRVS